MLAGFIIAFRESLEASLVIGIVLSYLQRTKQTVYNNVVYIAVVSGIVASIIGAIIFQRIAGGFEGSAEAIFEGVTMFLGAILLTTMILWMLRQKQVTQKLEQKVQSKIEDAKSFELFLLVFIAILREGIETIIFLNVAVRISEYGTLAGALAGLVAAIVLGYAIFVASKKINLKKFFTYTSILLILFAAGLVAHGIHEFQEVGIIPTIREHIWDINPPVVSENVYPLFI